MLQVFRLMGMPDKVIAFDGLPENLLAGFELCRAEGFPRHWKDWMGKQRKVTPIPPEKDLLTGQVRRFDPIIDEDSFFYLVDWTSNPSTEKWKEVCEYVRQNVSKEVRLKDKIEDMALPLAQNKTDSVTLEPEDVVVISLQKETQALVSDSGTPIKKEPAKEEKHVNVLKCQEPGCTSEFEGSYAKNSLRFHIQKKHKKVATTASV